MMKADHFTIECELCKGAWYQRAVLRNQAKYYEERMGKVEARRWMQARLAELHERHS